MTVTQTLEGGGKKLADNFGAFGMKSWSEVTGPRHFFGSLVGEAGVGKTDFFRGLEGCLILNYDLHSMPKPAPDAPPPLCQMFPVVNAEGQLIGPDGKAVTSAVTWGMYQDVIDALITAAHKGNPRPTTLVHDTLAPTVYMKKQAFAKEKGFEDWNDMPSGKPMMTAYGKVYDTYPKLMYDLKQVGYGNWIIAHILTQHVEQEGGGAKSLVTHNIPDKVYLRLFPQLDFLGAIEHKVETINAVDDKGVMQYGVRKEPRRYLVNLSDKLSNEMSRARVALPDRIGPLPSGGFQMFEDEYLKAAGISKESTPS
jgi:hypothetical protein